MSREMAGANPISADASARIANAGLIAALMVVFIHVDIQSDCPTYVRWTTGLIKAGLCTVAVPSFFVISGYLLAGHVGEAGWWRRAVLVRLLTLGVPYLIWGTLFYFSDYFRSRDASFVGLLRSLGFTTYEPPGLYPLWFVRSLMALIVVSPFFIWGLSRLGKGFMILLFAVSMFVPVLSKGDALISVAVRGFFAIFSGIFYFTVGIWVRQRGSLVQWSVGRPVLIGAIGLSLTMTGAVGELCGLTILRVYGVALGVPILVIGLWKLVPIVRWPQWLTRCAFPIFILHVFAIGFFNNFVVREVNGLLDFAAKYFFSVGLSIAFALVVARISPKVAHVLFGGRI